MNPSDNILAELKNRIAELENENEELQTDQSGAKHQILILQTQYAQLKSEIDGIKSRLHRLE
jgi:FtsZ-binding cell division protein ZapB